MSPDARAEILGRVRSALSDAERVPLPDIEAVDGERFGVATFVERAAAAGATVHDIGPGGEAAAVVAEILSANGAGRIAVSADPAAAAACAGFHGEVVPADADREVLFRCDAGVTCVQGAVAETGSLALRTDRERHRLASLVPDVHVALVRRDQVVPRLDDVMASIADGPPRCLTLITGPSRTADIELELVIGVHGPRELHIVLL